jgi:hypothetical protein
MASERSLGVTAEASHPFEPMSQLVNILHTVYDIDIRVT